MSVEAEQHVIEVVSCSQSSISHIIGPGGETIQRLQAETNTRIEIIAGPRVSITGTKAEEVMCAKEQIEAIIAHQANPDYEGEEGRALRHKAAEFAAARSLTMKEADAAFSANDKQKGHELLQQAKHLGEEMRQANVDAARAILTFNNTGNSDGVIDLHGLRADEAVDAVKARLNHLAAAGIKSDSTAAAASVTALDIICGAGLHTKAGQPVALMPAVEKHLRENNFVFAKRGAATLVVNLIEDVNNRSGSGVIEPRTTSVSRDAPMPPAPEPTTSTPAPSQEAGTTTAPIAPPSLAPAATPTKQKPGDSCCTVM
jgi:hypothetical protein